MSFGSVDDPAEIDQREPRWLQLAFAALGAVIAVGVAAWGLSTPGHINIGGVVLGETIGWTVAGFYVRELTKPRVR